MKRPALFLDRDGVINADLGYVHTVEDFQFMDGIFDLVAAANLKGYLVVVVTNQAGIGRGFYSEAQFHKITSWLTDKFIEQCARIDAVYFCPHHPTEGIGIYRQDCDCRKPSPGMIIDAMRDFDIELSKSVLVGDSLKDIHSANAAGIGRAFLFQSDKTHSAVPVECTVISDLRSVIPYLNSR